MNDKIPPRPTKKVIAPKMSAQRDEFGAVRRPSSASNAPLPKSPAPSSTPMILALILAMLACGASFYLFTQLRTQEVFLMAAADRISDLEQRLSATGEEMDQSAVALGVKVKELSEKTDELWKQMDKLWASAWRRNQAEIKELTSEMGKNRNSINSQITSVGNDLKTTKSSLDIISNSLDIMKEEFDLYVKSNSGVVNSIDEFNKNSQQAKNDITELRKTLDGLIKTNQRLNLRITTLENEQRAVEVVQPQG
ncbi:MAG: hypothetical protein V2I33_02605 [Kangiellaceae bacterium]|jgi:chromosome segregation ATPase|nr:hypothetical protein [Kangiellaceae bacterium]